MNVHLNKVEKRKKRSHLVKLSKNGEVFSSMSKPTITCGFTVSGHSLQCILPGSFREEKKTLVHNTSTRTFLVEEPTAENTRTHDLKMKTSWMFYGIGIIFCSIVFVTAYWQEEDEGKVLVDNKCQCVKVTSKFVPDKENPEEKVLERNLRIIVPLNARENISDPISPVRTKFVYKLSKLCDKCDVPSRTEKGVTFGESTLCGHPEEPCYTYDRNKCYTASTLFSHRGKTSTILTALNPEACYPD